jgi:hypothetical protein
MSGNVCLLLVENYGLLLLRGVYGLRPFKGFIVVYCRCAAFMGFIVVSQNLSTFQS